MSYLDPRVFHLTSSHLTRSDEIRLGRNMSHCYGALTPFQKRALRTCLGKLRSTQFREFSLLDISLLVPKVLNPQLLHAFQVSHISFWSVCADTVDFLLNISENTLLCLESQTRIRIRKIFWLVKRYYVDCFCEQAMVFVV